MTLEPLASYAHDAVVKDGRTVHIRPIRPDDLDGLMAMWERLSAESIRLRFFAPRKMDREQMRYFVELDWTTRFAAVAEQAGSIIGVSRFDILPEDEHRAEFAVLVEDGQQGRGIGTALTRALMEPAADMGITGFVAEVLRENNRMLSVMRDAGLEPAFDDYGSVVHTRFTTTPTESYLSTFDQQESASTVAALTSIFHPSSIAVVGASRDRQSVGGRVFSHLLSGEYTGPVYPVNPNATHVQSIAAYPSLAACPCVPEMMLVCVPAEDVMGVVAQGGELGVKAAVITSGGFSDVGDEGREQQLRTTARQFGLRIVGPNCMGVVNTAAAVRMNATLSSVLPPVGRIGFSSQSGALGLAILAAANRLGIGLSTFVSVGNKADISGNDLLQYWESDPDTDAILLYLESFGNPRKFGRLARRIGRRKPILAVKSGRTGAGSTSTPEVAAKASSTDVAVEALFRQAGVIRTDTLEEMFNVASVLVNQPLPTGNRVAILTNGGGPGVLAADACESNGMIVPALSDSTTTELMGFLPTHAATRNPVDVRAGGTAQEYGKCLSLLTRDPNVDALLVIFLPSVVTRSEDVAEEIVDAIQGAEREGSSIPVTCVFMVGQDVPQPLSDAGVPTFEFPEDAAKALGRVARYADWKRTPLGDIVTVSDIDEGAGHDVIRQAMSGSDRDGHWLTPSQTAKLLSSFGLSTAAVNNASEAVEMTVNVHYDASFGPILVVGMAGALMELMGDISVRILPLTDVDVDDMLTALKGYPLLTGFRGSPPVDIDALKALLFRLSALVEAYGEIDRVELNPVFVLPKGVSCVDARVRVARHARAPR